MSVDPGTGQVQAAYGIGVGYSVAGERAPGGSFSHAIAVDAGARGEAAPGSPASSGAGVSWSGLVKHYTNESGNLTLVDEVQIGPGISDGYIYIVQNNTITQTVTRTVTVTQVEERQVTVPAPAAVTVPESEPRIDPKWLGLGAAGALLFFLFARRG